MLKHTMRTWLVAAVGWSALVCAAEPAWETLVTGPITVKTRPLEGANVKEFLAEGEIDAPPLAVQQALSDTSRLRHFMPHVKDSREISDTQEDGSVYVYTLIDLPVLGKRDYVVKVATKQSLSADGTGTFRNEWHAEPDRLPRRNGIVRITKNDGGWTVTPSSDGKKSNVVYRFAVDPGGWIPGFAANLGNERGAKDTWAAVTAEARRIAAEKKER